MVLDHKSLATGLLLLHNIHFTGDALSGYKHIPSYPSLPPVVLIVLLGEALLVAVVAGQSS